jgi:glycosyltransferase involved in cell wall biosynthesis
MAAGLPVVCFDRENNRKYLGEGAQYAAEISSDALADAISELVANPQKMEYKGNLNKQNIGEFAWDASAEKIEKIYLNV